MARQPRTAQQNSQNQVVGSFSAIKYIQTAIEYLLATSKKHDLAV